MLHAEPGSNILRLRLCQPARPEIAMHTRRSLLLTAAVGGLALLAPAARAASDQGLVDEARITVQDFTGDTQFTDMRRKLARAKGVFIVPQLLKASRSEEHTSELQSLMRISYAVFCLKKKTQI